MDPRLNLVVANAHNRELRERAEAARVAWPDDGRPARRSRGDRRRIPSLHPLAVIASLVEHR